MVEIRGSIGWQARLLPAWHACHPAKPPANPAMRGMPANPTNPAMRTNPVMPANPAMRTNPGMRTNPAMPAIPPFPINVGCHSLPVLRLTMFGVNLVAWPKSLVL